MALANAHEVIKKIMVNLFSPEERRLADAIEQLIKENAEFYPNTPHDGFTYSGKVYDPKGLVRGKRTRVPLHSSLIDRMETLIADTEKVWTDRHFISQTLFLLLQPCNDLQDIRDALPNCVTDTLEELKPFQRTRPAAYTIATNARIYRQYEKLLPRLEFYSAMKMLY